MPVYVCVYRCACVGSVPMYVSMRMCVECFLRANYISSLFSADDCYSLLTSAICISFFLSNSFEQVFFFFFYKSLGSNSFRFLLLLLHNLQVVAAVYCSPREAIGLESTCS